MIEKAYLQTISYFDLFDFPLTEMEFFKYLWQEKITWDAHLEKLEQLVNEGVLATKQGFYFLPGREDIILKRANCVLPTEARLRRARLASRMISWVPFVRAIFVCNSVASETANSESDIDFFVVTEEKRLWMVRGITNFILKFSGLRTGKLTANRVCLTFYVGDQHLDLAPWRVSDDDVYLAYWLVQLQKLYDESGIFKKLYSENKWAERYVTLPDPEKFSEKKPIAKKILEFIFSGEIGDFCEFLSGRFSWWVLQPELKKQAAENSKAVVVQNGIIKLHAKDARRAIREKWLSKQNFYVK